MASDDPLQLDAFFASRGEPINWTSDAASSPHSFSPLCGFTASFELRGGNCGLAFAWYNETGSPPQTSDLHTIIPAGALEGASFSGTSIKNDPDYLGGLVGFALIGEPQKYCAQNHYSNPAWNQSCSSCSPSAPWITTLIYPSKRTSNAFYVAFEDGPTSSTAFNNDGDFNDAVYFVSGVTCVGGGQPCDTGRTGICAAGISQCSANGTTCQQVSQAGAEKCNGFDDDCNGQTDEGDICPSGLYCDKGRCVQNCASGEFQCPADKVCNLAGHCVEPKCKDVTCEDGKVCLGGTCKGPCDGVVCPNGQVCRVGACVDPCAGINCGSDQVCDNGVCVAKCNCLPCAGNKACVSSTGLCVEAACAGVTCASGTHCQAGNCVANCESVVCPIGQGCKNGQCIETTTDDKTSSPPSSPGLVSAPLPGGMSRTRKNLPRVGRRAAAAIWWVIRPATRWC
ncbi:hypothetical protein [Labilithrix luteola]|nr:hypothetical protein [Labilithrix luteola]